MTRARRRSLIATAALAATVGAAVPIVVALVGRSSSASFADTEVLATNRLGAAVLDIEIEGGAGGAPPSPSTGTPSDGSDAAVFSADNLAPGDRVSGHLEVANRGDLPLTFGLSARSDGRPLGRWLRFEVWRTSTGCAPGGTGPRLARDVALTTQPVSLVDLATAAEPSGLILEPGQSMVLCLGAVLPLETPNEAQGQTLDVTLVVAAEHWLGDAGEGDR